MHQNCRSGRTQAFCHILCICCLHKEQAVLLPENINHEALLIKLESVMNDKKGSICCYEWHHGWHCDLFQCIMNDKSSQFSDLNDVVNDKKVTILWTTALLISQTACFFDLHPPLSINMTYLRIFNTDETLVTWMRKESRICYQWEWWRIVQNNLRNSSNWNTAQWNVKTERHSLQKYF